MEAVKGNVVRSKQERYTVGKRSSAKDLSTFSGRVGHAMRVRREAIGKSVEDVQRALDAADIPATTAAIYHWESGRRPIPINALPVIADLLRVSVRSLIPAGKQE